MGQADIDALENIEEHEARVCIRSHRGSLSHFKVKEIVEELTSGYRMEEQL
jgi:hypothetical protein